MSRVGHLRARRGRRPCATMIRTAISHIHPILVTSLAAVINVVPLVSSPVCDSVTVAVVNNLAMKAVVALVLLPVFCAALFRVHGPTGMRSRRRWRCDSALLSQAILRLLYGYAAGPTPLADQVP